MKEPRILIFEQGCDSDWAATLKAQITTEAPEGLLLRHERHISQEPADSVAALTLAMQSWLPHLLLLLLPHEEKRGLEVLLTAAGHPPPAPPVVVVNDADDVQLFHKLVELRGSDF